MIWVPEEVVAQALQQENPWWKYRGSILEHSKPRKRLAFDKTKMVLDDLVTRRFVILSGVSRVGKSTIIYQLIESYLIKGIPEKNILYVSFGNPILKFINIDAILGIYDCLFATEGDKYLFFDEIHNIGSWESWMQTLYDTRPNVRLAAATRASPLQTTPRQEPDNGRWLLITIPTLSFCEYCRLLPMGRLPGGLDTIGVTNQNQPASENSTISLHQYSSLQQHFYRYLKIGGFPELALSDDDKNAQGQFRRNILGRLLDRDVLAFFKVRHPQQIEKLFLYLCMKPTDVFVAQSIAKDVDDISVPTLENYLNVLEQSHLIYRSEPLDIDNKGALKGRPRIYIADTAIRSAIMMQDENPPDEDELNLRVETAVFRHLSSFYQDTATQIGYFRKLREKEKKVDIVVNLPEGKILIDVRFRNRSKIRNTDAIVELSKRDDSSASRAFVLTRKLYDNGVSRHNTHVLIRRTPAIAFIYMLGLNEYLKQQNSELLRAHEAPDAACLFAWTV